MNRRNLFVYSLSFIMVYFGAVIADLACGPEIDPYDYYVSFYHYNKTPESDYRSYYFTTCQMFYEMAEPQDEKVVNAREWSRYFGKDVKVNDVVWAMYRLGSRADSILSKRYSAGLFKLPDSLSRNTFLVALNKQRNRDARKYYTALLRMNALRHTSWDRWDLADAPLDSNAISHAATQALKAARTEHNSFLKLRYYYMAQRMLPDRAAAMVYDKYIANDPSNSHIKGAALEYRGGAEYHKGNKAKAALMFLRVFDKYPERRLQAGNDFMYCGANNTQVIKLAKTAHEKAVVYAIQGFRNPHLDMPDLEMVYHYQPNSPLVGLLLTREVNKLEWAYQSHKVNKKLGYYTSRFMDLDTSDTLSKRYVAYILKLKGFCQKLATEQKCAEPGLGYITLAYLDWMQSKTADGLAAIDSIKRIKLNRAMFDQQQMIKLLLLTQKIKTLNSINETELLPTLKWLHQKTTDERKTVKAPVYYDSYINKWRANYDEFIDSLGYNYDYKNYNASARDFYQKILAPIYVKQRDTTKAALCMLEGTMNIEQMPIDEAYYWDTASGFWQCYLHSSGLRKMVEWRIRRPTNAYLNFLTGGIKRMNHDYLFDMLGTAYLREHNYSKALSCFQKTNRHRAKKSISNAFSVTSDISNPFVGRMLDFPKYTDTSHHTKLWYAKAMYKLQVKIKTDPQNAATYYYRMATGMYSTNIDGNAWELVSYEWHDDDYYYPKRFYYYADFIQAITAEKYYLKARSLSTNTEFKAKCTFMAAKCRQKQITQPEYDYNNERKSKIALAAYQKRVKHNPYFEVLAKTYSKTEFYKTAVHDCSYLRDYLRSW